MSIQMSENHIIDADDLCVAKYLTETLKEANRENIKYLVKAFRGTALSFVLGAGVTKNIGLPLWSELIRELFLRGLKVGVSGTANPVLNDILRSGDVGKFNAALARFMEGMDGAYSNVSAVESAEYILLRYIKIAYNDDKSMRLGGSATDIEDKAKTYLNLAIKDVLKDCYSRQPNAADKDPRTLPGWRLLNAISDFFTPRNIRERQSEGVPYVRQVITYNYDDALEYAAQPRKGRDVYDFDTFGIDEYHRYYAEQRTAVVHPHGVLKIFRDDAYAKEDARIVLTETDYNELGSMYSNRSNTVEAATYNNRNCLFIGLSLQDNNFKRIIKGIQIQPDEKDAIFDILSRDIYHVGGLGDDMHRQRMHFVFLSIDSCIGKNKETDTHINAVRQEYLTNQAMYLIKNRIFPIFVTHGDIPIVLEKIRSYLWELE